MNLQDIVKKEAERLYPYKDDYSQVQRILTGHQRNCFDTGFTFCLNTLAGSEGDIANDDRIAEAFRMLSIGSTEQAYIKIFEIIQQHTASAVAKAVGEKWVRVEDRLPEIPPPYYDKEMECTATPLNVDVIVFDGEDVYQKSYGIIEWEKDITHWQPLPEKPIKK